jgi:hypothetical protein
MAVMTMTMIMMRCWVMTIPWPEIVLARRTGDVFRNVGWWLGGVLLRSVVSKFGATTE